MGWLYRSVAGQSRFKHISRKAFEALPETIRQVAESSNRHDGLDWEDIGLAGALAEEIAEEARERERLRKEMEEDQEKDEED